MRIAKILVLAALLSLCFCLYEKSSVVKKVGLSNYASSVQSGLTLIVFYYHSCPRCIAFAPKMEQAALALKGIVKIGAFDSVSEKPPGWKARPVPYLALFADGKLVATKQELTAKGVVDFVLQNLRKVRLF